MRWDKKFKVGDLISYSYPNFKDKRVLGIVFHVYPNNTYLIKEARSNEEFVILGAFLTLESAR